MRMRVHFISVAIIHSIFVVCVLLVQQMLFLPLFLYTDVVYNGWHSTLYHATITVTLSQAWIPAAAEVFLFFHCYSPRNTQ
jgi:hypothetical protein